MQKQSGVNIDLGNRSSQTAFSYARETFSNRHGKKGAVASKTNGGFSNLLIFGNERIGIGSDGTGTKAEIAERTQIYDTLGYDLVAMVADDLAAAGFEPTNLSNVIDVDYLDKNIIAQMMKGLRDACNYAGITITGGEIAELGNRISGYGDQMHFNWSATAIGVLPDKLKTDIDGSQIKSGDVVVSLKSRGFRSNGFSSIRRILKEKLGNEWHNKSYNSQSTWGEKILTPSLIYAPLITNFIQNDIIPKGIAHITGGGIFDNLRRVLKMTNTGAVLDNLYSPLPEMLKIQEMGDVSNEDAYLWWNMGNGMLMIVDEQNVDRMLQDAEKMNYECQVAGRITTDNSISAVFPSFTLTKKY